jgi:hypothetical protein
MVYPPAPTKVLSESKSGTNTNRRGESINKKQHPNLLQGSFKQNKTSGGAILGAKITNT